MSNHSDIKIEQTVLGSLIMNPKNLSVYFFQLTENLFSTPENRLVFSTITNIFKKGKPIDALIVCNEIQKIHNQNLDLYIMNIYSSVSSDAHLEYYIRILVEFSIKRDFVEKFSRLTEIVQNSNEDIFDIRDKAFEYINHLFIDKFIENNKQNVSFNSLIQSIEDKFNSILQNEVTGINSSLNIINNVIGGWQNSDLVIVAGRPGMGKTAFLVQQVIDAISQNLPVGVFSLEMSSVQIATRIVTNITQIPNSSFLRKGLKEKEKEKFKNYKSYISNLNIHIDDTPSISIENLRLKAKMMVLKYDIKLLLVDYIQLVTHKSANREQEISNISRGLKAIAKELNIPVIALSQLSRNVESRPIKRPYLSDLRDSGSIEQDADIVIFPYRPEYYGQEFWDDEPSRKTENEVEIIIAKNRNGAIHSEKCKTNLAISSFYD